MGVLLCIHADNPACWKLVDYLSLAQVDLLVRVLSFPASERDFKSLLTLENIQEAIDHLDEFVPKILCE